MLITDRKLILFKVWFQLKERKINNKCKHTVINRKNIILGILESNRYMEWLDGDRDWECYLGK